MSRVESIQQLDYKKGDVLLAMVVCSLFLRDVPMGFREKVILCVIIMKFVDVYVKTQADIIWVDQQLKKMEGWDFNDVALRGSGTTEWDWSSDDKVLEDD